MLVQSTSMTERSSRFVRSAAILTYEFRCEACLLNFVQNYGANDVDYTDVDNASGLQAMKAGDVTQLKGPALLYTN